MLYKAENYKAKSVVCVIDNVQSVLSLEGVTHAKVMPSGVYQRPFLVVDHT